MALEKRFIEEFKQLPEDKQKEVLNFIEFMRAKEQIEKENLMDKVINKYKVALRELAK